MQKLKCYLVIFLMLVVVVRTSAQYHLGQGVMTGLVTDQRAVLQTRLTSSDTLIDDDLPGQSGWVRFEYWQEGEAEPMLSRWLQALPDNDFIVKVSIEDLGADSRYFYRCCYGPDTSDITCGAPGTFRTNPGAEIAAPVSMVVVTGMNYYHFHYGRYDPSTRYTGADKPLGYPALSSIIELEPDYFIGTGDNVYFDHPSQRDVERAVKRGHRPQPGLFGGKEVTDLQGIRKKYHVQFVQPRFRSLFARVGTYWEKDDHDYRVNDSDPYTTFPISHELGVESFREQLPVVDPDDDTDVTYRTMRISKDLQLWLLEGRDYRSANDDPVGPQKTIWGNTQRQWLYKTIAASDARYKLIISPTPMVGPDDAYKRDNHTNPDGFRYEGDAFFDWLTLTQQDTNSLFLVCGDRHWQYHARHPSGFEEFSTGALVGANARTGRKSGDPASTDPQGLIRQYYLQEFPAEVSGGFLMVAVQYEGNEPELVFSFFDEAGTLLYEAVR